jgi:hypothetical protein
MALPATDTFTGSDGTQLTAYSASWTLNKGDFDIQSNSLASDAANDTIAHWNADAFNADQYAQGTVVAYTGDWVATGVSVRCAASGETAYTVLYFHAPWKELGKYNATVYTSLASHDALIAVNDIVRLEVSGTTITPKVNGVTDADLGAQTDAALASGSAGVAGNSDTTAARLDSWSGGNLSAGVIAQLASVAWASAGQIAGVAVASISQIAGVAAQ